MKEVTYPSIISAYNQFGLFTTVVEENYFSVFDRNTDKVGLFSKEDAAFIVLKYVAAKGYLDILRNITYSVGRLDTIARFSPHEVQIVVQGIKAQCKIVLDDQDNIFKIVKEMKSILIFYRDMIIKEFAKWKWKEFKDTFGNSSTKSNSTFTLR